MSRLGFEQVPWAPAWRTDCKTQKGAGSEGRNRKSSEELVAMTWARGDAG